MKKTFIFLTFAILIAGVMAFLGRWNLTYCLAEGETDLPSVTITKNVPELSNDTTPDISLIVTSGANFSIKNGDTVLWSGTGTGEEQTIGMSELAEGTYNLALTATLGEETVTENLPSFTIDTTSPTLDIGPDILTNKKTSLSAEATDSSGINIVLWEELSGSGDISFDNSASLTTEFEADTDGAYVLQLTVFDNAGNKSVKNINVNWDTTPPEVSGVENGKTYNFDVTPAFNGTGKLDGESFVSGITVSTEGEHILVVNDEAGNQASVNFTIDKTSPFIEIKKDPDKDIYNDSYTITINFGDDCITKQYRLDSGDWTDYADLIIISDEGYHTIYARGKDAAGNETTAEASFEIDKTSPEIVVTKDPDREIYNGDYTFDIDYSDATVKEYKLDDGEWTAYVGQLIVSSEGEHTLIARGSDAAGNIGYSESIVFKIDKSVPNIVITSDPDKDLSNIDYSITIEFENAEVKQYKLDDSEWVDYTSPIVISTEGVHKIIARAKSVAGTEAVSGELIIKIDKTAPIVPEFTLDSINNENEKEFLIKGKTEANFEVICKIKDKTFDTTSDQNGDFEFILDLSDLPDGTVEIKISAKDQAGNQSEESLETTTKDTLVVNRPDGDENESANETVAEAIQTISSSGSTSITATTVSSSTKLPQTGINASFLSALCLLIGFPISAVSLKSFSKS